jgi:hypothetical protein
MLRITGKISLHSVLFLNLHFCREGKSTMVGDGIEYIFTNSRPSDFIKNEQDFEYDEEKYREMLLEAAETVLGLFGFDTTAYGDSPRKNKKWWHEIVDPASSRHRQ